MIQIRDYGKKSSEKISRYNASIIRNKGKLFLFYRLQRGGSMKDSFLESVELEESLKPKKLTPTPFNLPPLSKNCRFVDPRAFSFKSKIWVSYSVYDELSGLASMGFCKLNKSREPIRIFYPNYATNLSNIQKFGKPSKPKQKNWEKNWQFFQQGKKLCSVYSIVPHKILEFSSDLKEISQVYNSFSFMDWKFGEMRGGTPPIKVGNEYFSFFQSHQKIGKIRIYHMGAYAFSSTKPFKITQFTSLPLVSSDKLNLRHLAVVFPCGAIIEDGIWTISYGYNDYSIKFMKIRHSDLLKRMSTKNLDSKLNKFLLSARYFLRKSIFEQ